VHPPFLVRDRTQRARVRAVGNVVESQEPGRYGGNEDRLATSALPDDLWATVVTVYHPEGVATAATLRLPICLENLMFGIERPIRTLIRANLS